MDSAPRGVADWDGDAVTIDPNAAAFPKAGISQLSDHTGNNYEDGANEGITIRAHFAAMAMQGIIGNAREPVTAEMVAEWSAKAADALIAALNK